MRLDNQGFTMVELLVTMAIMAVLSVIAAPSFQGALRSSRLTTAINDFSTALGTARSEAIKYNRHVVVLKTGANWENGWQVFSDANNNDVLDGAGDETACNATNPAQDCLILTHEALPNNLTLRPTHDSHATTFIRYVPSGLASNLEDGAVPISFHLCDTNIATTPQAGTSRLLILNAIGRTRMGVDMNKNGIPERLPNTDITTCTP